MIKVTKVTKKKTAPSAKSPSKKKTGKSSSDFKDDLKNLDDKWSQKFARLEALCLANSFSVPVLW